MTLLLFFLSSFKSFVGTFRVCSLSYTELAFWRVLPSALYLFLPEGRGLREDKTTEFTAIISGSKTNGLTFCKSLTVYIKLIWPLITIGWIQLI